MSSRKKAGREGRTRGKERAAEERRKGERRGQEKRSTVRKKEGQEGKRKGDKGPPFKASSPGTQFL